MTVRTMLGMLRPSLLTAYSRNLHVAATCGQSAPVIWNVNGFARYCGLDQVAPASVEYAYSYDVIGVPPSVFGEPHFRVTTEGCGPATAVLKYGAVGAAAEAGVIWITPATSATDAPIARARRRVLRLSTFNTVAPQGTKRTTGR